MSENLKILKELTDNLSNQRENELNYIFGAKTVLFCVTGDKGFFKRLSPSWKDVLGWEIEELLTTPWLFFVHPDDVQKTLDIVDQNAKTGVVVPTFTNRYRCKDGSYRTLLWQGIMFTPSNEIYTTCIDITDMQGVAHG